MQNTSSETFYQHLNINEAKSFQHIYGKTTNTKFFLQRWRDMSRKSPLKMAITTAAHEHERKTSKYVSNKKRCQITGSSTLAVGVVPLVTLVTSALVAAFLVLANLRAHSGNFALIYVCNRTTE